MTRRRAFATVVVLGAVAAILGALELGVRFLAPQPTKISVPVVIDPDLIYRLPSGVIGTDRKEEFTVTIRTNSVGLRDRDYPPVKSPGAKARVLVLGDSMTFAEGVEAEQTYPKLLERALGDRCEVINAAVRGYGTDQELVLFEQLIPRYRPDVVVLAFFSFNDLDDNLDGALFDLRDGRLVRQPLTDESSPKYRYYRRQAFIQNFPGYASLVAHSHLVNFVRRRWAMREYHRSFVRPDVETGREDRAWRLTSELLTAWAGLARQERIVPVLLVIPPWELIYETSDTVDRARNEKALAWARSAGIRALDPKPVLLEQARLAEPLYYPQDRHLTPRGHEVVASYVLQTLTADGTLPCGATAAQRMHATPEGPA